MLFAFARDGYLPGALARVHARFQHAVRRHRRADGDRDRRSRPRALREAGDHRERGDAPRVRRVLPRCARAPPDESACSARRRRRFARRWAARVPVAGARRNRLAADEPHPDEWQSLAAIAVVASSSTSVSYAPGASARGGGAGDVSATTSADVRDPLLQFRAEFPILERTTYLVSNSLGAMPRAVPERLAEYVDQWAELGVRAWAERLVGDARRPSATRSRR